MNHFLTNLKLRLLLFHPDHHAGKGEELYRRASKVHGSLPMAAAVLFSPCSSLRVIVLAMGPTETASAGSFSHLLKGYPAAPTVLLKVRLNASTAKSSKPGFLPDSLHKFEKNHPYPGNRLMLNI